ncbi:MAG: hypothetical protein Q4E78_05685 [Eubacteriales bacterium]|nr:hypothetical protein [Eubacteriales bacterium]
MKKIKRLTVIYFALAAILAVIAVTFAAYTRLSSAKRVVTVKGTEQLFTSDVLMEYQQDSQIQTRVLSFGEEEKVFSITVSNHLQGDKTKYDTKNIPYTLKVELLDADGKSVTDSNVYSMLSVNGTSMASNPVSISDQVLNGVEAKDIMYTFRFDSEIMNYRIKITAETTRSEYKSLGRVISITTNSAATDWSGSFIDAEKTAVDANKELGIINYKISGQTEGDYVLSWDSARVEIDKWCLEKMTSTKPAKNDNNNIESVELHLGAENTPKQYLITFYRTYAEQDLNEDWNTISKYINFQKK